ncbi:MAG: carbohydrate kinase [Schwartzia sp.]|nr:carbohydrate kinase [Schwartzia sp. (in: firmicutes)]
MKKELEEILQGMQKKRILIIGDAIADIYLLGRIARISREAPVLVLEQAEEKIVAGGAANVVNNVATLGGSAEACGIVGTDSAAEGLRAVLAKNGALIDGLLTDKSRPTIAKTRIIAGGRETVSQQIVRVDRESRLPLAPELEDALLKYAEKRIEEGLAGVVLSDYGGAVVTDAVQQRLIKLCREKDIPAIVDSRYSVKRFEGVSYVKQNDSELAAALGRELSDDASIRAAGKELLELLGAEGVLVTRGDKGMTVIERGGKITDIPVRDKSEVFDVSGAGDTCVAAFILAKAAGADSVSAAELANLASGIAVRKQGTATVSAEELREAIVKFA